MSKIQRMELIFEEIIKRNPSVNLGALKEKRGSKFLFPIYLNKSINETDLEMLNLSTRSNNCLRRAGFVTVGDVVSNINGREDLKRIRNCGNKCVDEIMEQLFCYQYGTLSGEKKDRFIKRVLELNQI